MGARDSLLENLVVREAGVRLTVSPAVWAAGQQRLSPEAMTSALKGAAHDLAGQRKPAESFAYAHTAEASGLLMLPMGTMLGEDLQGRPVLLTHDLLMPPQPEAAMRLLQGSLRPGQQFAVLEVPDAEAEFIKATAPAIMARVSGQRRAALDGGRRPRAAMLELADGVTDYEVTGLQPNDDEPAPGLVAVLPMDRLHYTQLMQGGLRRRFEEIAVPAPKVLAHLSPRLLLTPPALQRK